MEKFPVYAWKESLDDSFDNYLIVRFVFVPESGKILVFAVVQAVLIDNKLVEVVRFDYSQNEPLHVHRFYTKTCDKVYLDFNVNFLLIENLIIEIKDNWRKNLIKFRGE